MCIRDSSCVFGAQLLSLYSTDPAVIQVGLNRMYIVCGPYFLCGIMDVMTGVLRGVGYSLLPMIVSLMGACVFLIFWVMTVFAANRTMDCLMVSYPVSWALTFLVLVGIFVVLWNKKIKPRYTPCLLYTSRHVISLPCLSSIEILYLVIQALL